MTFAPNPPHWRRVVGAIFGLLLFQGYTMAINGIAAPFLARSFGLDQAGIARLFAWISLSSMGALLLSRLADRVGRRRILLLCATATPVLAAVAALAEDLVLFTIVEVFLFAFITASVSASVVMLAEAMPVDLRAKGQGYGGLALGLGGGLCVILVPLLTDNGYSWRWLLVLAACGILGTPFLHRALPESQRWEQAAERGATRDTRFYDVFLPLYRRRAIPILICALLSMTTATAVTSWGFFHAVSVVGLSTRAASAMMIAGGAMSFVGLTGGAWAAERFGRVPTVSCASVLVALGSLFFYWGPPADFAYPAYWLAAGFCWYMSAVNAWMVGSNSASTELFPTALRGTMVGWFAITQAIASVSSQTIIALLASRLGGLSVVTGYLALLALPSALIFYLFIDETRGLSLEAAAREDKV